MYSTVQHVVINNQVTIWVLLSNCTPDFFLHHRRRRYLHRLPSLWFRGLYRILDDRQHCPPVANYLLTCLQKYFLSRIFKPLSEIWRGNIFFFADCPQNTMNRCCTAPVVAHNLIRARVLRTVYRKTSICGEITPSVIWGLQARTEMQPPCHSSVSALDHIVDWYSHFRLVYNTWGTPRLFFFTLSLPLPLVSACVCVRGECGICVSVSCSRGENWAAVTDVYSLCSRHIYF